MAETRQDANTRLASIFGRGAKTEEELTSFIEMSGDMPQAIADHMNVSLTSDRAKRVFGQLIKERGLSGDQMVLTDSGGESYFPFLTTGEIRLALQEESCLGIKEKPESTSTRPKPRFITKAMFFTE